MGRIVVGGIIEKDGKFLLVQEGKEECRGKWNIPAGHLEPNETILDGVKREVKEETGCNVELTGLLQIGNKVFHDDVFISIVFSMKLLEEDIRFDKKEILDVKWFTYEELLNKKEELRAYSLIMNSISAFLENKIVDIHVITMMYKVYGTYS